MTLCLVFVRKKVGEKYRERERETCTLAQRERGRVKRLYRGYYLCEVKQRKLPAFIRTLVTNVLAPGLTSV